MFYDMSNVIRERENFNLIRELAITKRDIKDDKVYQSSSFNECETHYIFKITFFLRTYFISNFY